MCARRSPRTTTRNLYLSNLWFKNAAADLEKLLGYLLGKFDHEAVHCPLYNVSPARLEALAPALLALGFEQRQAVDLEFDLADLPPLGLPLVLEAWSEENDGLFQGVFEQGEGFRPSEAFWAWLKRWRGPFHPNLWFVASETIDQEPVGYALYGLLQDGIDGVYYLTAAGVLAAYRDSSEMLRRLLISSMQELAARSPFARIQTLVTQRDPKLIHILESLGFERTSSYPVFVKQPR
jgi:ribosomal protein S18 acetylase RimI-like enzyme